MKFLRRIIVALGAVLLLAGVTTLTTCQTTLVSQERNIKTVFITLMESKNWLQIIGSLHASYINNTLLPMASHAEAYFNPPLVHPSLPNYLWLEVGVNFGVFNDDPPSANHQSMTRHLVTLLQQKNISWKTYQEDISCANCPLVSNELYAVKHNPFVYFDDVTDNLDPSWANCISHVRPFSELAMDLASNTVTQYNFITPNLCNDMHNDCAPLNDAI